MRICEWQKRKPNLSVHPICIHLRKLKSTELQLNTTYDISLLLTKSNSLNFYWRLMIFKFIRKKVKLHQKQPFVGVLQNSCSKSFAKFTGKQLCWSIFLTLSIRRPLSYRNQSNDLQSKSMDWFLYDNGLRLERVNRVAGFQSVTLLERDSSTDVFL